MNKMLFCAGIAFLTLNMADSVATAQTNFGATVYTPGSTSDLCINEAIDFVQQKFGAQTQIQAWFDKGSQATDKYRWRVRVYTNLCDGTFLMSYGMFDIDDCKRPRSTMPHMLYSAIGMGACRKLLPKPVYLSTYGH